MFKISDIYLAVEYLKLFEISAIMLFIELVCDFGAI